MATDLTATSGAEYSQVPPGVRPSIVLVSLDQFGYDVCTAVLMTVAATEPSRAATCRLTSMTDGLDRRALVEQLLAAEGDGGTGDIMVVVWLVGDLVADAHDLTLTR